MTTILSTKRHAQKTCANHNGVAIQTVPTPDAAAIRKTWRGAVIMPQFCSPRCTTYSDFKALKTFWLWWGLKVARNLSGADGSNWLQTSLDSSIIKRASCNAWLLSPGSEYLVVHCPQDTNTPHTTSPTTELAQHTGKLQTGPMLLTTVASPSILPNRSARISARERVMNWLGRLLWCTEANMQSRFQCANQIQTRIVFRTRVKNI